MKQLIIANGINFAILCVIILGFSFLPKWLSFLLLIVWFVYVIYSNYNLLLKNSDDLIVRMKNASKSDEFKKMSYIMESCYLSVISREKLFNSENTNVKMCETYNLIKNQIINNIKAVTVFFENYDYISKPSTKYCANLVYENTQLIVKLNQLVEFIINIDNSTGDLDTSSVDDILNSLRSVISNEEQ